MDVWGVIPARWASTRFEGKVLAEINGQPMIQHVWQQARKADCLDHVLIACDDPRVFDAARAFGAEVVMTSPEHQSGTDRIAEALRDQAAEIVVNIQGDEPLIDPVVIDQLVTALKEDPESVMATTVIRLTSEQEWRDPNVVKAVADSNGYALYFSRAAIPHDRDAAGLEQVACYKHLGLYAYRKNFLLGFSRLPSSSLEQAEKLEQLRALQAGYRIKLVETSVGTIGVDTPEDLRRVEDILLQKEER